MSISQNYPITSPSLSLDFANTKVLDPRITFSRPTDAVYYDGKTVTKAEENLLKYSQEFDNGFWIKNNVIVTANNTEAPDGTTTAELVDDGTIASYHIIFNSTVTVVATHSYTISCFAKNVDRQYLSLSASTGASQNAGAVFDVLGGTVSSSAADGSGWSVTSTSITSVGNSWYRCALTFVCGNSATMTSRIGLVSGTTIPSGTFGIPATYTGTNKQLFIWGAQLEQRTSVTAYQPTTTQPITNYIPTLLTAPANTARFDHNPVTGESLGLLVEEQRTNLFTYSEDFSNAAWSKNNVTVTANTIVAPDGSLTSDKVIANVGINFHSVIQNPSITPSTVYTLSCFLKRGEYQYGFLYSDGATKGAIFDLDSLTVTGSILGVPTSSTIVDAGNGWARCSITFTSGVSTFSNTWVGPTSSPTSANIAGDGYSGIYIWGAQLE
jgi:hypothetical protein